MKKKTLLVISAALLTILACSTEGLRPQTEVPTIKATATSIENSIPETVESNDSAVATSVASTVEANDNLIATSVAFTVEASISTTTAIEETREATIEALPSETHTPTSLPTTTSTNLPEPTPTVIATTPTPTSAPTVSVSVDTNCRTGPGKAYDRLGVLKIGESAEVVGKKTSYNYWIIKNPDADGNCWLWGEYATVTGDTSNLQEYAVPPTPATTTPTSASTPTVSVSVDTNCRTGPGIVYDRLGVLKIGESAEVIGKKTSYNYWIIKNPDTSGNCWLWGEYATVTGDTSNLQEYAVPPTPATTTPTPTSAPTVSVSVDTNCRTGPGIVYDRLGVLKIGESAEVIGKKTSYNYWIIKNPDANGNCWLWGEYATVTGDTSNLQEYAVPPIP